jgi:Tol biopolymer transport system component
MSPEQAEGKDVDHRSDIFSLGVVMFETLTGERPFTGGSHAEIVSNLLKSDPPPLTKLRPELPPLIANLISKCLNKSRRGRYQSMRDVNAVLNRVWSTISRSTSRSSSLRRLYREFTPSPSRWILGAAVFVIVAAVGARFYFLNSQPTQAVNFSDLTFRKLSQANNVVYAHITPDGRSIAYNAIDEDERRSLWIRQVDDRNALQLLPPTEVAFWGGLTIARDSSQILYITAEWAARHGTLYRISSLGGAPRKLVDTVNDLGSLSPDGERILFVRYGDAIQVISARVSDGSDEQVIHSVPEGTIIRDPQYSSDGSKIYFSQVEGVGRAEMWKLVEYTVAGGQQRVVLQPRRERINEIAVLEGDDALLVNQEDPISKLNQLYLVDVDTGNETRVTNDLNSYFGLSVSADGNAIVSAQRYISKDVWVGNPDSPSSLKKVTNEPTAHLTVAWADDNTLIYGAVDNNVPHIWKASIDGGAPQLLTPNDSADYGPAVSPDGRFIFFTSERSGERKVWRIDVDGSNPLLITDVEGSAFSPSISPDGQHVIFKWNKPNGESIARVPLSGGQVTEMPYFSDTYWAISSDGTQVAYAESRENAPPIVAVRRLSEPEPYVSFEIAPIHILEWMDNDRALLYRQREGGTEPFSTVWIQYLDRKTPSVFYSAKPDNIFDIAFSPDGKRMATVQGRLITDAVMLSKVRDR